MSFDLEIVDSDLKLKSDGTLKIAVDTVKLRQDLLKIILTSLGSNKFHPWYGCAVGENIIGKNLPQNLLEEDIRSSISQSLDNLKTLQLAQVSTQRVSLAEQIAEVGDINIGRSPADQRQLNIILSVLTRRLSKIEEIFTITS